MKKKNQLCFFWQINYDWVGCWANSNSVPISIDCYKKNSIKEYLKFCWPKKKRVFKIYDKKKEYLKFYIIFQSYKCS